MNRDELQKLKIAVLYGGVSSEREDLTADRTGRPDGAEPLRLQRRRHRC